MFRRVLAALLLVGTSAIAAETPRLGVPATPEDIPFWAQAIFPDGSGLPDGRGSAVEGEALYAERCSACHGPSGEGPVKKLAGGIGSLGTDRPVKSVGSQWPFATTLFDYIRRAMPANAPKSLTADEGYALTAYILAMNGIVAEDAVLDRSSLPTVVMPAKPLLVDHWSDRGERPY